MSSQWLVNGSGHVQQESIQSPVSDFFLTSHGQSGSSHYSQNSQYNMSSLYFILCRILQMTIHEVRQLDREQREKTERPHLSQLNLDMGRDGKRYFWLSKDSYGKAKAAFLLSKSSRNLIRKQAKGALQK